MVKPFDECIARPGSDRHLLTEHLLAVARACGRKDGGDSERLAYLAGLLHDAGKARHSWQCEIMRENPGALPPHAPIGTAIFLNLAMTLIDRWSAGDRRKRDAFTNEVLDWARVIHRHHGALPDLKDDSVFWLTASSEATGGMEKTLQEMDIAGLFAFLSDELAEVEPLGIWELLSGIQKIGDLSKWQRLCQRSQRAIYHTVKKAPYSQLLESELVDKFAVCAANLVAGDRYHAGAFEEVVLSPERASLGLENLKSYCDRAAFDALAKGCDRNLTNQREKLQQHAAERLVCNTGSHFYTLQLPTGYGKTLTALRGALESCKQGVTQRIIYVAPYISILSQATTELANASGLEALQHHHLSVVDLDDEKQIDITASWQAEIVTTTFNQLFRVLFPARAQDCLKRRALCRAFVIVDEVQIIAAGYWNLFVRRLESVAKREEMRVLLTTATLPSLERGASSKSVSLSNSVPPIGRYRIALETDPRNAAQTAHSALQKSKNTGPIAVVLNTVRDAYDVYEAITSEADNARVFLLTGAMLPGHKASIIANVREILKANYAEELGRPLIVVCTQILEAGVDLDFSAIMRARSILPSIAQTAGRANRHGSRERADVSVFDYVREDGRYTRSFVYRDSVSRKLTDEAFTQNPSLQEEELAELLSEYYQAYSIRSPGTQAMQRIADAAYGRWSALAELEPFDQSVPGVTVFVPIPYADFQDSDSVKNLLNKFSLESPEDIFKGYFDAEYKKELSFNERKQLSALFNLHTVTVPKQIAVKIAAPVFPDAPDSICSLSDVNFYCKDTGVAHWYGKKEPLLMF